MRITGLGLAALAVVSIVGCQGAASSPSTSAPPTATSSAEAPSPSTAAEPIRIGALFPVSGDMAAFGNDGVAAAQLAAELFNEQGGVDGRMVEIVPADVTTPEQAASEAQRLITQEGINVLIGTSASSLGLPASAAADRQGALYWDVIDQSPQISGRGLAGVFQFAPHADVQGKAAVTFTADKLAPALGKQPQDLKIGIIFANDAYSASVADGAIAQAKELGLNVVATESYDPAITDLSSVILKLKSAGVEVLVGSQLPADAILLNTQSRQLDFNPVLVSAFGYDNPEAVTALGDCINGIFLSSNPQFSAIDPTKLEPDGRALAEAYGPGWKEKTGRETSVDSDTIFNATWVLLNNLIKATGSEDPKVLAEAARKLDLPVGSLGNAWGVRFDESQYNTRTVQSINEYQEQKQVLIYPETLVFGEMTLVPRPAWSDICS